MKSEVQETGSQYLPKVSQHADFAAHPTVDRLNVKMTRQQRTNLTCRKICCTAKLPVGAGKESGSELPLMQFLYPPVKKASRLGASFCHPRGVSLTPMDGRKVPDGGKTDSFIELTLGHKGGCHNFFCHMILPFLRKSGAGGSP